MSGEPERAGQDVRPVVLVVVAAIEAWSFFARGTWAPAPLAVAALLLTYFTLVPRAMRPFSNALLWLAARLGRVNNWLVLAVLFYAILTPVGLLMRLFGSDRLNLRPPVAGDSYWKRRADGGKDLDFRKMY